MQAPDVLLLSQFWMNTRESKVIRHFLFQLDFMQLSSTNAAMFKKKNLPKKKWKKRSKNLPIIGPHFFQYCRLAQNQPISHILIYTVAILKKMGANYEQIFRAFFSFFHGQSIAAFVLESCIKSSWKRNQKMFWKVDSEF